MVACRDRASGDGSVTGGRPHAAAIPSSTTTTANARRGARLGMRHSVTGPLTPNFKLQTSKQSRLAFDVRHSVFGVWRLAFGIRTARYPAAPRQCRLMTA